MDDLYLHKLGKAMIELRQTIKDDLSALNQICESHPNSKYSSMALIELLEEYLEIIDGCKEAD